MVNYKNSATISFNNIHYCAYCGKEAKNDIEIYDRYDTIDHFYCDCPEAKKSIELNNQISKLKEDMDKEVHKVSNPYYKQIDELKKKFPKVKYSVQTKVMKIEK